MGPQGIQVTWRPHEEPCPQGTDTRRRPEQYPVRSSESCGLGHGAWPARSPPAVGRGSQRPVRDLIFQEVSHALLGERTSRKIRIFREGNPSLLYWLFTSLNRGILFCPVPFFYLVEKKDFRVMSIPKRRNSLILQRGQETLFVEQSGA